MMQVQEMHSRYCAVLHTLGIPTEGVRMYDPHEYFEAVYELELAITLSQKKLSEFAEHALSTLRTEAMKHIQW